MSPNTMDNSINLLELEVVFLEKNRGTARLATNLESDFPVLAFVKVNVQGQVNISVLRAAHLCKRKLNGLLFLDDKGR